MDTVREINIQPITVEDFESFHACLDSVARERKFLGYVQAPSLKKTRDWLQAEMEEGAIRLVALDDTRVVGWCDIAVSRNEGFTHAGRLGMGILREYRGQRLGSRLLEAALSSAKEGGLERVGLDVFASNTPAIKLYEKFGFQHEGRKRKARKLDGVYDDIILMALLFDQ